MRKNNLNYIVPIYTFSLVSSARGVPIWNKKLGKVVNVALQVIGKHYTDDLFLYIPGQFLFSKMTSKWSFLISKNYYLFTRSIFCVSNFALLWNKAIWQFLFQIDDWCSADFINILHWGQPQKNCQFAIRGCLRFS